ncbi:MAG: ABC transporter ATP-binding protein [Clostridia bacterium]|nr:ABC transporter ATP-binding protein [Clostridia bacterium]
MQIICNNIALGYENHIVSQNISFSVARGEYLCVVGENGAGKSTLMKAILGLHPPVSGSIRFGDDLRRSEIGYLPQQTSLQRDFPASVQEVVLSGCLNRCGLRPFYNRAERELARSRMERLGVLPLRNRCYRELSGGQQQRVLLARALCATRRLLLLDEPVSGLDPAATTDMYAIIRRLNREDGITVVMISHDISSAVREADHILHLSHHPLFFGTTEEYLKSDVAKAFLRAEEGITA